MQELRFSVGRVFPDLQRSYGSFPSPTRRESLVYNLTIGVGWEVGITKPGCENYVQTNVLPNWGRGTAR